MSSSARRSLSPTDRFYRSLYLAIALVPLLILLLKSQGINFMTWGCPTLRWIGIPCPGWGMTRSLLALLQGNWQRSLYYHAFGPLILAGGCIAMVHLGFELLKNQKLQMAYLPLVQRPKFYLWFFFALFAYHGTRLQALAQAGVLQIWFTHSPIGQFWLHLP
jgi:hypothetical protein